MVFEKMGVGWKTAPLPEDMTASREDLMWWLELDESLPWKFAKTYADHTPHSYVRRENEWAKAGLTRREYHRALSVIWTFGKPEQFYGRVNIYLHHPSRDRKWFATGVALKERYEVALINTAPISDHYGEQSIRGFDLDASYSPFDAVCLLPQRQVGNPGRVWGRVHGGRDVVDVLDVYSGHGHALQASLVPKRPQLYTPVDPSRGMLNQLAVQHPWVRDFQNMSPLDYLGSPSARKHDAVVALNGRAAYLTPEEARGLLGLTGKVAVFSFPREGTQMPVPVDAEQARAVLKVLESTGSAVGYADGDFWEVVVSK